MATHLVTGYAGVEHVAAADDATLHASMVGKGKYVFDSGSNFAYEVVSNNLIKIKDGDLMNQGRHIKIAANDYEELEIDNGIAGVYRWDMIVCRYNKDVDASIESASLVVVKGISSTTPTDPTIKSGDIFGGDLVDDFPLYRVCLDGLDIVNVVPLFEVVPNMENMREELIEETDNIKAAINQAAKTWIIPEDMRIDIYGIGAPGERYWKPEYSSYSYLDVLNGHYYSSAYGDSYDEALTSVQDKFDNLKGIACTMDEQQKFSETLASGATNQILIPLYTATEDCVVNFLSYTQFSAASGGDRIYNLLCGNAAPIASAQSNVSTTINIPLSGMFKMKAGEVLKAQLMQTSNASLTATLYYTLGVVPI